MILLRKIYRAYLKFTERKPRFKFCRRHPQVSFLGASLLIGVIACNTMVSAPNADRISSSALNGVVSTTAENDTTTFANSAYDKAKVAVSIVSATDFDKLQALPASLPAATTQRFWPPKWSATESQSTATAPKTMANTITTTVTEAANQVIANTDATVAELQPILNIPFSAEIQHRILNEACDGDLRMFCLAMTIAKKESEFRPNLVGDNGLSYGYYQIKTDCHVERIAKYGFTKDNLFDPVKGAIVCVDYLRELLWDYQKSGDVSHFLFMMYNQGPSSARNSVKHMVNSTEYSRKAMNIFASYLAEVGLESGVPFTQ